MKKLIIGSAVLLTLATATSLALTQPSNLMAESDLPIKVQHQQEQLDNHEARITNTENDVTGLQNKTSTPPSVQRVEVPVVQPAPVSQPSPTPPEPEPTPVTVTSYEQIPVENSEDVDCKYTYSDGTTYQWHWKTVEYNQVRIVHTTGKCDQSAIGTEKP